MKTMHVLAGLSLGLSACGGADSEIHVREAVDPGMTLVVTADTTRSFTPVAGSVVARRRAEISTRMMARVADVLVEIGDPVRLGDALVLLGAADVAAGETKAAAGVASGRSIASASETEVARRCM